MTIEIIDGFKFIPHPEGDMLLVESDRLDDYIRYAIEKEIKGISLQEYHGYKLTNIDFLKNNNFFTKIWVVNYLTDIDISGVHYLNALRSISLSNNKQKIDFSCFPELENASIDWNEKLTNLNTCKKLERLVIWKFKPRSKDFIELKELDALQSLEITQSNIESFSGIEYLHRLNSFEGHYLPKLESLKGIEAASKKLKILILDNSKKLVNYEDWLSKLEVLEKLILSKCGELKDLKFINEIHNLKFFSFIHTNIKDGNLDILEERKIEYVGFDDKRHYSHKMKDINPSFSWKVSNNSRP
jgi:hypothetical protein